MPELSPLRQGVELPPLAGISVVYPPVPSSLHTKQFGSFGHCGKPQTGRGVTYNFLCDCEVEEPTFVNIRQASAKRRCPPYYFNLLCF